MVTSKSRRKRSAATIADSVEAGRGNGDGQPGADGHKSRITPRIRKRLSLVARTAARRGCKKLAEACRLCDVDPVAFYANCHKNPGEAREEFKKEDVQHLLPERGTRRESLALALKACQQIYAVVALVAKSCILPEIAARRVGLTYKSYVGLTVKFPEVFEAACDQWGVGFPPPRIEDGTEIEVRTPGKLVVRARMAKGALIVEGAGHSKTEAWRRMGQAKGSGPWLSNRYDDYWKWLCERAREVLLVPEGEFEIAFCRPDTEENRKAHSRRSDRVSPKRAAAGAERLVNRGFLPKWDKDKGELRMYGYLVKKVDLVRASNQVLVLDGFEEEDWPSIMDDPLPGKKNLDRQERLANTRDGLNNRIEYIRFFTRGGTQIGWETTS